MDERWRPFADAVVGQLVRFTSDYADYRGRVEGWQQLAAAGAHDALVAALLDDLTMLSAAYQHADLLPVADDAAAAVMANAVLEAAHRLA